MDDALSNLAVLENYAIDSLERERSTTENARQPQLDEDDVSLSSPGEHLAMQALHELRELGEVLFGSSSTDHRWRYRLVEPRVRMKQLSESLRIGWRPGRLEALYELGGIQG